MSGIDRRTNGSGSGLPASTDFYQLAWSDTDPTPARQAIPSSYRERVAQILRETELGLSDGVGSTSGQPRGFNSSNWDDDDVIFERRSESATSDVTSGPANRSSGVQAQVADTGQAGTGTQGHDHANTARTSTGRRQNRRRDDEGNSPKKRMRVEVDAGTLTEVLALLPAGTFEMSVDSYIDDDDILLCPLETPLREAVVTQAGLHRKMMDRRLTLKIFLFALGLMATSTVLVLAIYFLVRALKSNT